MSDTNDRGSADQGPATPPTPPTPTPPAAAPSTSTPPHSGAPTPPIPPRTPHNGPHNGSGTPYLPSAGGQPGQPPYARPQGYTGPQGYTAAQGLGAPQGYTGPQGYTAPQGYGAARPHTAPSHPGAAFGAASASDTQPTLPLGNGTGTGAGTVTTDDAPKKKSGAGKLTALVLAFVLVGGAAGAGGVYAGTQLAAPATSTQSQSTGGGSVVVNNTESVNEITAIAAKVTPSVVTIAVSAGGSGGTGSGVILTDDGYVVTNTHVITLDGASDTGAIRVTTSDGRIYNAEIVGLDPIYDLAVIKLEDAAGLTPIEFARSSRLNVGDTAVAVGAPLGLANTVTTGIVSALNRSIEIQSAAVPDSGGADEDEDSRNGQNGPFTFDIPGMPSTGATETIKISVIQTDAAINPGNSGGALVDGEGKLIGINVAIATAGSSSGEAGSIGVGFAIPSDLVKRVTDEIIADGAATHGLLGASVQSAAALEGATIAGAHIAEVVPGGAAEAGGLREGDIVTAFNDVPVTDSVDLTALVRAAAAGSEATVTYVRDGRTQTVDVVLGSLDQ